MERRTVLQLVASTGLACCFPYLVACKSGKQYARVIQPGEKEMIGSHQAGQETFRPLIEESVSKLLARHEASTEIHPASAGEVLPPERHTVCFVGVTNKSAEEIGDFKEQIYQCIDARLQESPHFSSLNRNYVDAGITELRLRPESLFVPEKMRQFTDLMERNGRPIHYLMFATITSGSTKENSEYQRDYQLVLDLVDVRTGQSDKQIASISKAYHQSRLSRWSAQKSPF